MHEWDGLSRDVGEMCLDLISFCCLFFSLQFDMLHRLQFGCRFIDRALYFFFFRLGALGVFGKGGNWYDIMIYYFFLLSQLMWCDISTGIKCQKKTPPPPPNYFRLAVLPPMKHTHRSTLKSGGFFFVNMAWRT